MNMKEQLEIQAMYAAAAKGDKPEVPKAPKKRGRPKKSVLKPADNA